MSLQQHFGQNTYTRKEVADAVFLILDIRQIKFDDDTSLLRLVQYAAMECFIHEHDEDFYNRIASTKIGQYEYDAVEIVRDYLIDLEIHGITTLLIEG